jgi:hypothetical protein
VAEYASTIDAANVTLKSLSQSDDATDRSVMDDTIDTFQSLQLKLDQLTRRAVALDELSNDRFADPTDSIAAKSAGLKQSESEFQVAVDSINFRAINRLERAGDLNRAVEMFAKKVRDFPSVLKLAWKPLDTPRSPLQEIEYELLLIQRGLWRSMVKVEDKSDYQSLAGPLNLAAKEISDLAVRYAKIENRDAVFRIYSRYLDAALSLNGLITQTADELNVRYGELDDGAEWQRYLDAVESLKAT